jgi:hypothetical protein
MKTIVLQSFRTVRMPAWIQSCLETVRTWAGVHGFQYRFAGDEFLLLPPEWYRRKAGQYITIVTDLARLQFVRECLLEGFDRCIWIDADVVVFAPARFCLSERLSFAFCKEVWVELDHQGLPIYRTKVNNCVCVFDRASLPLVEGYIERCLAIMGEIPSPRDHLEVGTRHLTALHEKSPLSLIKSVGLFSPVVMSAVLLRDKKILEPFMKHHGEPLYAANLCNNFTGRLPIYVFEGVVAILKESRGATLNQFVEVEN